MPWSKLLWPACQIICKTHLGKPKKDTSFCSPLP
jgi:hypothetical protein